MQTLLSIQFFMHLEFQSSEELSFPFFAVDPRLSLLKSSLSDVSISLDELCLR